MLAVDHAQEADWIEGLPLPREQTALFGHDRAAATLQDAYRTGRMHHAWLIAGPKGIGKATLAFAFARFALSHPTPLAAPRPMTGALLPADARVVGQVAQGAHPNLLHLRRPYDEANKKLKTQLTVDEVRRTVGFFGKAAGGDGYRIAIVDAADDMNPSAANALLKMLEEPPARAMFLVIAHSPGALLPTIRSRCRRLALDPLGIDDLDRALAALGVDVAEADRPALAAVAEGSVRRAAECIESGGLQLFAAFETLAAGLPKLDRAALHRFADAAIGRKADDHFGLVVDFAKAWLSARLRLESHAPAGGLNRYAVAWERITTVAAETEGLNLDRRQALIAIMQSLAETGRF